MRFESSAGDLICSIRPGSTVACPACGTALVTARLLGEWVPPNNAEAERAILATMMADLEAAGTIAESLVADDFHSRRHRVVFEAICEVYDAGRRPDAVLVRERMRASTLIDDCVGFEFVESLGTPTPSAANLEEYIGIVKRCSLARRLVDACMQTAKEAVDDPDTLGVLDEAERRIHEVASARPAREVVHIKELLQEEFEALLKRRETPGLMTGLPTGIKELDELTGGLQRSDFVLLASGPCVGRTAFVHQLARHAALVEKTPVLLLSPGISRHHVTLRLLSSHCKLDYRKLRGGFVGDDGLNDVINHGMGPLRNSPIFVDDTQRIGVMELRAKARRMKTHHQIALVVVDDLQLVTPPSGGSGDEVAVTAQLLESLARELNVPVIATLPVAPDTEPGGPATRTADKLYAAGVPEQHADALLLLERERSTDGAFESDAHLHVLKQRNGPTGWLAGGGGQPRTTWRPDGRA